MKTTPEPKSERPKAEKLRIRTGVRGGLMHNPAFAE